MDSRLAFLTRPILPLLLIAAHSTALAAVGLTQLTSDVSPRGEANLSIPIEVPPGVGGIQPTLELVYGHRVTSTLFGRGWMISGLSSLTRCGRTWAQDTSVSAVRNEAGDQFCLDGNRLRYDGGPYRLEVETFSRVTPFGVAGTGPQWFLVESKDGLLFEYGHTADSRVESLGQTTPHTWQLSSVRDRSGNMMNYSYVEDANGASRIASITYTANPAAGVSAPNEVAFVWEAKPAGDVEVRYLAGSPITQTARLDRVDVKVNGVTVRRYELSYESALSPASHSRLASIQECAGSPLDCRTPAAFSYHNRPTGLGAETAALTLPDATQSPHMMDMNRDGRADIVYRSVAGGGTWMFALATDDAGSYGTPVNTNITAPPSGEVIMDYNNDAQMDIVYPQGGTWWVMRAVSGGFLAPFNTGTPLEDQSASGRAARGMDIDGDAHEDLVWVMSSATGVNAIHYKLRVDGATFSATTYTVWNTTTGALPLNAFTDLNVAARSPDFDGDGRRDLVFTSSEGQRRLNVVSPAGPTFSVQIRVGTMAAWGDFNGDGQTDLLYNSGVEGGNFVRYGSGTLFSAPVAVPSLPNTNQYNGDRVVFDYDGDGRDDILLSDPDLANWYLLKATPTGFDALVNTGEPKRAGAQVADINADSYLDVAYNYQGSWYRRMQAATPTLPADLLTAATDSYGNSHTFTYRPITDPAVYADVEFANSPIQAFKPGTYVVRTQTVPSGVVGTQETFTFAYEDIRWDPQRRLFLGFETMSRQSAQSGLWRSVTYMVTFPWLGTEQRGETRVGGASGAQVESFSGLPTFVYFGTGGNRRTLAWLYRISRGENEVAPYVSRKRQIDTDFTMDTSTGTFSSIHTDVIEQNDANGLQPFSIYQIDEDHTALFSDFNTWCIGRPSTSVLTAQHDQFAGAAQSRRTDTTWDAVKCRPTSQVTDPLVTAHRVTRTFTYDDDSGEAQPDLGNLVRVTASASGQSNRVTRFVWSAGGQFPAQITNALNETHELTWDAVVGQLTGIKDPNQVQLGYLYDGFGRKIRENRPDGTYTEWLYQNCAAVGCVGSNNRLAVTETRRGTTATVITDKTLFLDLLDRPIVAREKMLAGDYARVDWEYNAKGEVSRHSFPCTWSTASVPCTRWNTYTYDAISRPTVIARPRSDSDASVVTTTIERMGMTTRITDPSGEARVIIENAVGAMLRGQDNGGNIVSYDYDAFGRVRRIRDNAGTTLRTFTYNSVGYLTNTSDVNQGNWVYVPDGWGQLASRTDANGKQLAFTYDLLGRTRTVTMPEGAGTILKTFTFGTSSTAHNIGRLEWMQTEGTGVTTFRQSNFFDAQGRLNRTTYLEGANTHEFLYDYNAENGFLEKLTYPFSTTGFRMHLTYEYQNGHLLRAWSGLNETIWRAQTMNPRGDITLEQVGVATNGVTLDIASTFDVVTGLLRARSTTYTSGAVNGVNVQNLGYLYDDGRNLTQRQDNRQGLTENLYYDAMDRLDLAQKGTGQVTGDYSYDARGNITFNSRLGNYNYTATVAGCTYYAHAQIHAVRQVTAVGGSPTYNYCYDANGNMVNRNGTSISWYADNLPKAVVQDTNNSSTFEYDAMDLRWKHVYRIAGATHTTTYLSPLLERVETPTTTTWKHYVFANGERVAVYVRRSNGAKNLYFFTRDNLGGVAAFTDSKGSYKVNESFQVFGQRRGSDWGNAPTTWEATQMTDTMRLGFTMHEHLDSTGLIHMNGRVYDPALARFVSPDPMLADPSDPQDHNRYSYVRNNPGSWIDPTGFWPGDEHSPGLDRQPMTPNGGFLSLWARGHGTRCGCVGGRGGPPNDPRMISADRMGPVLTAASGTIMGRGFDSKQLAKMFLGTDASLALLKALRDRDPGQWVGNVTFGGEFGRYRPDLIYVGPSSFRYQLFEVKHIGLQAAATDDVDFYLGLPTVKSSFEAGNTDLIFRGQGTMVVEAVWFFGHTKYNFYPGPEPGVVVYTINSQSDIVQNISDVIDELVRNGFGLGTAPWWDSKRRDNWKFP